MKELNITGVKVLLSRSPLQDAEPLQAWDAADELLVSTLEQYEEPENSVCIVNDSFGAITLLCKQRNDGAHFFMVSDSLLGQHACQQNLLRNQVSTERLTYLPTHRLTNDLVLELGEGKETEGKETEDEIQSETQGETQGETREVEGASAAGTHSSIHCPVDQLLFKIPKSLGQLEQQLHLLRPLLSPNTLIIGTGMVKRIHRSTLNLIEQIIGPTTTSQATKKARLIFVKMDPDLKVDRSSYPRSFSVPNTVTKTPESAELCGHGGVFSSADLDIGARLLISLMPDTEGEVDMIDLGCGTGVIGVVGALRNPQAKVTFVDESFAAIESARQSVTNTFDPARADTMKFLTANCLEGVDDESYDLVLCNPPFHDQGSRDLDTSLNMFREAKRVLRLGGALRVVGNRHLAYHKKLKRIFGNVSVLGSNAKFVVLEATR